MESGWLGLIEMFVVLTFALAWGGLELYTLWLDKRRTEEEKRRPVNENTPEAQ